MCATLATAPWPFAGCLPQRTTFLFAGGIIGNPLGTCNIGYCGVQDVGYRSWSTVTLSTSGNRFNPQGQAVGSLSRSSIRGGCRIPAIRCGARVQPGIFDGGEVDEGGASGRGLQLHKQPDCRWFQRSPDVRTDGIHTSAGR